MRKIFKYMDPELIMGIVISLIILAIGCYAFFVTIANIPNTSGGTYYQSIEQAKNNTTTIGNQVFNIIGIVLVIGAIMTIVGLVYSYVRPGGY